MAKKAENVWFAFHDGGTIEITPDTPCRVQVGTNYEFGYIGNTECGICDVFYSNAWLSGVKVPHPITIHLAIDVRIQGNREVSKILNDIHHALNNNIEAIPGVIDFPKVGIAANKE